jgi:hypothetical protein
MIQILCNLKILNIVDNFNKKPIFYYVVWVSILKVPLTKESVLWQY